ncbi:hypothetical protein [Pedobacter sp. BS3]|nr:hypothetical protein [Pedobacter sp. BS3]
MKNITPGFMNNRPEPVVNFTGKAPGKVDNVFAKNLLMLNNYLLPG